MKVLPELAKEFEPVRQGLRRVVEEGGPEFRDTALSYLEATNQLIGMAVPNGALEDSARAEFTARLKTHTAKIVTHVVSQNWPLALRVAYNLLASPPGETTTYPDVPLPPPEPLPPPGPKKKPVKHSKQAK